MTVKLDIPALAARINKAHSVVSAICEGRQNWTMSVPAQAHSDPDLVITDGLAAGTEAITALTTALEIGRAMGMAQAAEICDASAAEHSCHEAKPLDGDFTAADARAERHWAGEAHRLAIAIRSASTQGSRPKSGL